MKLKLLSDEEYFYAKWKPTYRFFISEFIERNNKYAEIEFRLDEPVDWAISLIEKIIKENGWKVSLELCNNTWYLAKDKAS